MPPKRKAPTKRAVQKTKAPITTLLYGPSGNGKTSFAAQFPKPGFICDSQERGIDFLCRAKLCPDPVWSETIDADAASSWDKLLKRIWDAALDRSIQTLVLESITGIENICFIYHCREHFNNDHSREGFYNRWQGPKNAARFDWPKLISALDAVHQNGKNVVVTAHCQVKEESDPRGVNVIKYVPYCEKDTWARLHRWASSVFFLGQILEVDTSKQGLRKVAKQDFDRVIYTEGTPYCVAKNWYGLHGNIPLGSSPQEGYANFKKRMNDWNV